MKKRTGLACLGFMFLIVGTTMSMGCSAQGDSSVASTSTVNKSAASQGKVDPSTSKDDARAPGKTKDRKIPGSAQKNKPTMKDLPQTDAEWKKRLTPQQYYVTRQKGTEPAFTGKYTDCFRKGVYRCVGCGTELFASEEKFHSGCGWPAFSKPVAEASVEETADTSFSMLRTEITCRRCGAHLGHVFSDGPPPTGLRYCINSAALILDESPAATKDDSDR